MMREILFRGKRADNGEWVEGNLFIPDKPETPTQICIGTNVVRITYDIDPETVGQYTGLTDKNGQKVFEGDIIAHQFYGEERIDGVVKYGTFNCSCCDGVYGWYINDGDIRDLESEDDEYSTNSYVIGNIHDNPELLEEGANDDL